MTAQAKPKATLVSKYNALVSTICAGLLFKLVVIVNGLSIENAAIKEQIKGIEQKYVATGSRVSDIRMDLSQLSGVVNTNGNRITRLEAILPNKNQFKVKN